MMDLQANKDCFTILTRCCQLRPLVLLILIVFLSENETRVANTHVSETVLFCAPMLVFEVLWVKIPNGSCELSFHPGPKRFRKKGRTLSARKAPVLSVQNTSANCHHPVVPLECYAQVEIERTILTAMLLLWLSLP